eukprot:1909463-Rhodomonas_salina.1
MVIRWHGWQPESDRAGHWHECDDGRRARAGTGIMTYIDSDHDHDHVTAARGSKGRALAGPGMSWRGGTGTLMTEADSLRLRASKRAGEL